ncbi:MAG: alpha/beta hydrolase [Byssovorax sp.]
MRYDLDLAIGVLNGTIGDYLKRTGNGLATSMGLVHAGRALPLDRAALVAAYPQASARVAVLVHGLMSTESVWEMLDGTTYGSRLAQDLGVTPLYVRYNSGLHVSENGEALDALLERLVAEYPVPIEEMILLGHSMGGLVIRSAAHAAGTGEGEGERRWLPLVKRAFYLGTPHLGAPLERFGNVLTWALRAVGDAVGDPTTQLISDILNLRSSGVKDLRYANLCREDWEGSDVDALLQNRRYPVSLLPQIRHHLVAATLSGDPRLALLFGDAIVPLRSATGRSTPPDRSALFPQEHVRILPRFNHLSLAHEPKVYTLLRAWCEESP